MHTEKDLEDLHVLSMSTLNLIKVFIRTSTGLIGLLVICRMQQRENTGCSAVGLAQMWLSVEIVWARSRQFQIGEGVYCMECMMLCFSQQDPFLVSEMAERGVEGELTQRLLGVKEQQNGEVTGKNS